jgi:hypothetical protein
MASSIIKTRMSVSFSAGQVRHRRIGVLSAAERWGPETARLGWQQGHDILLMPGRKICNFVHADLSLRVLCKGLCGIIANNSLALFTLRCIVFVCS